MSFMGIHRDIFNCHYEFKELVEGAAKSQGCEEPVRKTAILYYKALSCPKCHWPTAEKEDGLPYHLPSKLSTYKEQDKLRNSRTLTTTPSTYSLHQADMHACIHIKTCTHANTPPTDWYGIQKAKGKEKHVFSSPSTSILKIQSMLPAEAFLA